MVNPHTDMYGGSSDPGFNVNVGSNNYSGNPFIINNIGTLGSGFF